MQICKSINCPNLLATQLPFNQTTDDDLNVTLADDVNVTSIGALSMHELHELLILDDCHSSKPLINNNDIDPNESYYDIRPIEHGCMTPSQLSCKLGKASHIVFLYAHKLSEYSP